jgi:hypothetical protein
MIKLIKHGINLKSNKMAEEKISTEGLPEGYDKLIQLIGSAIEDAKKFYGKGNQAASTRVRKNLSDVTKVCKELRMQVLIDRK